MRVSLTMIYGLTMDADDPSGLLRIPERAKPFDFSSHSWDEEPDAIADRVTRYAESDVVPVVLGYSFGGSKAIDTCQKLNESRVPVTCLFLLDPVPTRGWGVLNFTDFRVPDNVRQSYCWWRAPWLPPCSCPVRRALWPTQNFKRKIPHADFTEDPEIADFIVNYIQEVQTL